MKAQETRHCLNVQRSHIVNSLVEAVFNPIVESLIAGDEGSFTVTFKRETDEFSDTVLVTVKPIETP